MLAAEAGKNEVVNELLNSGFKVDSEVKGWTAAELAWQNNHQEVLLSLLKADSKYPKTFDNKNLRGLLRLHIGSIERLFQQISKGDTVNVLKFIKKNPQQKQIYNPKNFSAAVYAVAYKQFGVYKVLLENNVFISPNQKMDEVTSGFNESEIKELKEIHENYSRDHPDKHIKIITAMSKMSPDEKEIDNRMETIERAYTDLNKIPGCDLLLKSVAKVNDSIIFFDFNRTCVSYIDPLLDAGVNGAYYINGNAYIAAKDLLNPATRNHALGVIAHEFCHCAVQLAFKNYAKPYGVNDYEKQEQFTKIVNEIKNMEDNEEIIQDVFDNYKEEFHHAEMIVRAPQLLAFYRDNTEAIDRCREKYSKLFDYFDTFVLPKIEENIPSIESMLVQKLRQEISNLNGHIRSNNDEIDAQYAQNAELENANGGVMNCKYSTC